MNRITTSLARAIDVDRRTRALALGAIALAMTLGLTATATATPKGKFAVFSDCPLTTPGLTACVYAETTSGEFVVGSTTVPISKPVVLQGGVISKFKENEAEEVEVTEEFVGAADGHTLSATPLNVPGGLAGLIKCNEISNFLAKLACEVVFENGLTGVTATTELAAPASSIGLNEGNLLVGEGTALSLPVKVKLSNPLLGESCYIGSNAHPVVLNLTTGTTSPPEPNKPIKGSPGKISVIEGLLRDEGASLVNNSFAAPGVDGCGGIFSFIIDPLVDAKVELPAAAGRNTAILNSTFEQAGVKAVKESE